MRKIRKSLNFLGLCLLLQSPVWAVAQSYPTSDQFLPVATIDQDRLFSGSLFGQSFNKKFQDDANLLAEENRRKETELTDEENVLTEKRKTLENEEFRKLAAVFNDKVEAIRRNQSQKLNNLNASRVQAQRAFFAQVKPVIVELMQEHSIQYILNDQAIFMSGGTGDITDIAIERIDQTFGEFTPEAPK
jgi:Skp family chaperone for outer membrane proteins